MSKTEQRRLILIAKQDCFKLSEKRELQIRNGEIYISCCCRGEISASRLGVAVVVRLVLIGLVLLSW